MLTDHRTQALITTWLRSRLGDFVLRVVIGMHRTVCSPALATCSRHVVGLAGIMLLGAVVLSTAARRPYLHQSDPGIHASKAPATDLTHPDIAPIPPPAQVHMCITSPPSHAGRLPFPQSALFKLQAIFSVQALRSPPNV